MRRRRAFASTFFKLFATNHSPASQAKPLHELLCCLPKVLVPEGLSYNNLFRVLIVQFIGAEAFDVRSVKKSCIHIAHPDGERLVPILECPSDRFTVESLASIAGMSRSAR